MEDDQMAWPGKRIILISFETYRMRQSQSLWRRIERARETTKVVARQPTKMV